jgi:hypothetical protein
LPLPLAAGEVALLQIKRHGLSLGLASLLLTGLELASLQLSKCSIKGNIIE